MKDLNVTKFYATYFSRVSPSLLNGFLAIVPWRISLISSISYIRELFRVEK